MKTRRFLHVVGVLMLTGVILSCSYVTKMFTGETEKSSEQSGTGDEGESGQSATGGEGESQQSSAGAGESCEPIVGTWKQVVFHGLTGRKNTYLVSGDEFDKYFYSTTATGGSGQTAGQGAELWRTPTGLDWEMVGEPGMGNPENNFLIVYIWGDRLYVIAYGNQQFSLWVSQDGKAFHQLRGDWPEKAVGAHMHVVKNSLVLFVGNREEGLQAWASSDGERFEKVLAGGLEDPANYTTDSLNSLQLPSLEDWTYLGIRNAVKGGEVWRSKDGRNWERSLKGGFDDPSNASLLPQLTYSDHVYVEAYNPNGVNVFRTPDGEQWEKVVENGFELAEHQATSAWLEPYEDALYLVTNNDDPRAWGAAPSSASPGTGSAGGQGGGTGSAVSPGGGSSSAYTENFSPTGFGLWKGQDGKSWQQVGKPGFGNPNNYYAVINTRRCVFYLVAFNYHDGNQVWRSTDGENWELFFSAPASATNEGGGLTEYFGSLYYIENDLMQGAQVWRYGP